MGRAIEVSIVALGRAFLAHPANRTLRTRLRTGRLSPEAFYGDLLRVALRTLFLFSAFSEEREASLPATYEDWQARFRELSRAGKLFGDLRAPLLDRAAIEEASWASVLAHLSLRFGGTELGCAYEYLLGCRLVIHGKQTLQLESAADERRKATGSYYTPDILVRMLLDASLEPILAGGVKRPKIVDPSVGSGHFLLAVARRLAREMPMREALRSCIYGVDIDPFAVAICRFTLWRELSGPLSEARILDRKIVCGNSLVGATRGLLANGIPDVAYHAVEGDELSICRELRLRNIRERKELAFERKAADAWCAAHTLRKRKDVAVPVGQTLELPEVAREAERYRFFHWELAFPEVFRKGGFDLAIGNPPFIHAIQQRGVDRTARIVAARTPQLGGTADLAFRFLAISADLVRSGGWVAMVQPRAALAARALEAFRRDTPNGLHPRMLNALERADYFDGAAVFVSLVVLGPEGPCRVGDAQEIAATDIGSNWFAAALGEPRQVTGGCALGTTFQVMASMTAGDAYDVSRWVIDSREGEAPKFLTTGLIQPNSCLWGEEACRYLGNRFHYPRLPFGEDMPNSLRGRLTNARRPKVLVAGLGSRLEAFLDGEGGYVGAVSTYSIYHPEDDVSQLARLCGWLNSDEVTRQFRIELGANALGGGSITVKKDWLRDLTLSY